MGSKVRIFFLMILDFALRSRLLQLFFVLSSTSHMGRGCVLGLAQSGKMVAKCEGGLALFVVLRSHL